MNYRINRFEKGEYMEKELKDKKRREKEIHELSLIDKRMEKANRFAKMLLLSIIVVTVIYIVDEIASNVDSKMRTFMIYDLFHINYGDTGSDAYSSAVSKLNIATIPTYLVFFLLPLYKMLADKFGRKLFIVLNTIGMGIGMLTCMLAPNYIIYLIGFVVICFFIPNDAQVIYIMEVSPEKHRAKLCSITKGIALLSVSLIGVFKTIFYKQEDLTTWRLVFLIPVILAFVIGFLSIFLTSETPVFLKNRKEYLSKTEEEREADRQKALTDKTQAGGIKGAFHYIVHNKQLRWITIILIIFQFAVGIVGYENETMQFGGQSDNLNSSFHIIEPIVYAIFAFFSGFLSDWLGRKKSCVIFGAFGVLGEIGFIMCAKLMPYTISQTVLLAIFNGLMYGGLWSLSDCLFLVMPAESTPTNIRASVNGLITYTGGVGKIVGLLVGILFPIIGGSKNIGYFQLFVFVPVILLSIILLGFKVKETKGINLDNVEDELEKIEVTE
jgi:MFS family permease